MMADGRLWLGDSLPSIYSASLHIKFLSPTPNTAERASVVYRYSIALLEQWVKSFTSDYVVSFTTVKRTVERVITEYDKFIKCSRRNTPKSIRQINQEWRRHCNINGRDMLPKEMKGRPSKKRKASEEVTLTPSPPSQYDTLLDIGRATAALTGTELRFYRDQCGPKEYSLSEEVDWEFEVERDANRMEQMLQNEIDAADASFSEAPEYQEDISLNSSREERHMRREMVLAKNAPLCTISTQTDGNFPKSRPEIRGVRNFHESVKDAICTASVRCAISIPKARTAYQAIMEKGFGFQYYLSAKEQKKYEPSLHVIPEDESHQHEETESEPPKQQSRQVRSKESYESYKYVLPSERVVATFKHDKSLHQEIMAGEALGDLEIGTKVTLHYDTTTRSRIEGEWPALILNFLNNVPEKCKMIKLRALFFAHEDRDEITRLIVETLSRLSVATGNRFSAKQLWEHIYAFMTDAVTKNLAIEKEVAETLESTHIPLHILCKSHTCEKLDDACLNALVEVESRIQFAELVCRRQPQLKSFIRQSKCVALTALKALLALVSHEASAKPTSLSKEFDLQLEKDGIAKSMSLYKERRFTKLGYSAAAVVDCLPQYKTVLEETSTLNLLVQACKLYVDNEYVLAAFKALGCFTFKVTMPFLNCVEQCDQNALLPILKQLYEDLKDGKMETLQRYSVPWTHINTGKLEPTTPLDCVLLQKMCTEAAKGVHLQCSREYWEEDEECKIRATQLHKLTPDERACLPTENLSCERYLSRFGGLASLSAAKSNRFYKAKRIRDDLMFETKMNEQERDVSKSAKDIIDQLKAMEILWTEQQKERLKKKIQDAVAKKVRKSKYKDILLSKCKLHGGPATSVDDVRNLVRTIDESKLRTCLRSEIGFQKALHPFDAQERSHLYKMNFLSVDELTENLIILFGEYDTTGGNESIQFPTEDEIFNKITGTTEPLSPSTSTDSEFTPNTPLAVLWDQDGGTRYWCIGFVVCQVEDDTIKVDHLQPQKDRSCQHWVRGKSDDVQLVSREQVIPVNVVGEWNLRNERQPVFALENVDDIVTSFEKYL